MAVKGLEVISEGPRSEIGEICTIKLADGSFLQAESVSTMTDIKIKKFFFI